MDEKIEAIKKWLGTGSINIFGLPMSGKDTLGVRLAETLGSRFLSSGMIIRAMEKETKNDMTASGELIPTDVFYDWVLPYFDREDLKENSLVLSSVGRWAGEETEVMKAARSGGHPIMAAIILDVSEADVMDRWDLIQKYGDEQRTAREDDKVLEVFKTRIKEFDLKTRPVLQTYNEKGLLIHVRGDQEREKVFEETIDKIFQFATM